MRSRTLSLLAAAVVALAAADARATTSCTFSTVVGVSFGSYDVFDVFPLDSAGGLTFVCQGVGAADTIVIDLGRGNAGTFLPRQMLGVGTALTYNLYLDAARSAIWGDGTSGSSHYGPVTPTSGIGVTVPIYGRVPARQNVAAGSYADTIVVTIVF